VKKRFMRTPFQRGGTGICSVSHFGGKEKTVTGLWWNPERLYDMLRKNGKDVRKHADGGDAADSDFPAGSASGAGGRPGDHLGDRGGAGTGGVAGNGGPDAAGLGRGRCQRAPSGGGSPVGSADG